ncbi:MAG: hypothetical protein JWQ25_3096 [Daejeonella sp.]|nr:hypothetical protein [Daejeonella sp.]
MKKTFTKSLIAVATVVAVLFACKKDESKSSLKAEKLVAQKCLQDSKGISTSSDSPYNVYLYKITDNGDRTFTWEWRVRNLNPGNGSSGTVQDLSHWNIDLGDCITSDDIKSGATSTDGITWTPIAAGDLVVKQDKSQDCYTDPIFKFDLGTTGSNISYYRLTIDKNVSHTAVTAVYKSGKNTGCGVFTTCGFGCPATL